MLMHGGLVAWNMHYLPDSRASRRVSPLQLNLTSIGTPRPLAPSVSGVDLARPQGATSVQVVAGATLRV